jgi:glycosyltransferase involved in cell wall biosynthesis
MSTKINVLLVIGSLHYGGAERVVANLAKGLNRDRFDVRIVCTRAIGKVGEELQSQGLSVALTGSNTRWSRRLAPLNLLSALREDRPDIIHTHGVVALSAAGPLSYVGTLPPWIHTFHYGNYPYAKQRQMWIERLLSRGASQLIAVAEAQREAVIRYNRVRPESIRTVFNGVDANPHSDDASTRNRKRLELGFSANDILIGTVAVLSEQKGVTYLLQAARRLADKDRRIRFLIVGGGPLEADLRGQASRLGLEGVVTFTGWRSDVGQLLTTFDVFVMSSLWEAMPLTLLEAMAAGKAIVVTDVGDNARLVQNDLSAVVVPPRDDAALAAAIHRLVVEPDTRTRLGARALEEFRSKYTVSHMVHQHEAIYTSLARA